MESTGMEAESQREVERLLEFSEAMSLIVANTSPGSKRMIIKNHSFGTRNYSFTKLFFST